jgi:hypothetical protein
LAVEDFDKRTQNEMENRLDVKQNLWYKHPRDKIEHVERCAGSVKQPISFLWSGFANAFYPGEAMDFRTQNRGHLGWQRTSEVPERHLQQKSRLGSRR